MMMGVDVLLAERARQGKPIRVAMAGCGFMGRGLVNQIVNSVPGMTLSAIAVRDPSKGIKALGDAGVDRCGRRPQRWPTREGNPCRNSGRHR